MTTPLTPETLAELWRLHAATTTGPWVVCPMDMYIFAADENMVCEMRGHGAEKSGQRAEGSQACNAAFIAAAHAHLPALMQELQDLNERVAEHECWPADWQNGVRDALRAERDELRAERDELRVVVTEWELTAVREGILDRGDIE